MFETGPFIGLELQFIGQLCYKGTESTVSASHDRDNMYTPTYLAFYVRSGGLNSGPHAWEAGILQIIHLLSP